MNNRPVSSVSKIFLSPPDSIDPLESIRFNVQHQVSFEFLKFPCCLVKWSRKGRGGGRVGASLSNSEFIAIINVIIFIACVVNIIEKKVRKDRLNARCARVCVDAPRYKAHYTHFLILTYPVLRKNLPR